MSTLNNNTPPMKSRYKFELLAPADVAQRCSFSSFRRVPEAYSAYLKQLQILRANAYVDDGAIRASDVDHEGRFRMNGDEESWHLLLIDHDFDRVVGCARYLVHSGAVNFDQLGISRTAIVADPVTGPSIRQVIKSDLAFARHRNFCYIEIGGWAVSPHWRRTTAALDILAGSFALGELWGGCIGLCTATFRNASAQMIRRFSGSTSEMVCSPFIVYFDPHYDCPMELIRLNSQPAERYAGFVEDAKVRLRQIQPLRRDSFPVTLPLPLIA